LKGIRTKKVATDIEQTRAQLRSSLPTEAEPWNERWAILLRHAPETLSDETAEVPGQEKEQRKVGKLRMIGAIGIVREQEIGYRLHPEFWGKGFMTEALAMFIDMWWGMESTFFSALSFRKTKGVLIWE
jgi:[ribosomal protein S5]-alanine N-acetyltransferase